MKILLHPIWHDQVDKVSHSSKIPHLLWLFIDCHHLSVFETWMNPSGWLLDTSYPQKWTMTAAKGCYFVQVSIAIMSEIINVNLINAYLHWTKNCYVFKYCAWKITTKMPLLMEHDWVVLILSFAHYPWLFDPGACAEQPTLVMDSSLKLSAWPFCRARNCQVISKGTSCLLIVANGFQLGARKGLSVTFTIVTMLLVVRKLHIF